MKNSLEAVKLYLLDFLSVQGQERSIPIRMVDAANGVIFEETYEGSGLFRLLSGQGHPFYLTFPQILSIRSYDVYFDLNPRDGHSASPARCSEDEVEDILDRNTNKKTGEVEGIRGIQDRNNPDNGVRARSEPRKL